MFGLPQVIRTTTVKMLEYEREFVCVKCKHVFTVRADFEQCYTLAPPTRCPPGAMADGSQCDSTKFRCTQEATVNPTACRDYQEIKIQEQISKLAVGTIPRSIWVVLEDDLVDSCKTGDDVVVSGVVRQRWQPLRQETRCDLEVVIHGNHVRVSNAQGTGAHSAPYQHSLAQPGAPVGEVRGLNPIAILRELTFVLPACTDARKHS